MLQALLKLRNRRIKQQLLPRVEEQDQRKDQPNEDRELERIYQHLEELYYQEFLGDWEEDEDEWVLNLPGVSQGYQ